MIQSFSLKRFSDGKIRTINFARSLMHKYATGSRAATMTTRSVSSLFIRMPAQRAV